MSSTTAKAPSQVADSQGSPKSKSLKKKAANKPQVAPGATKQEQILALLKPGTTIAAIMHATGWQQHSVRGFFAGVVRKKLGLNLTSKKTEAGRVYRIGAGNPSKALKAVPRKAR